MVERTGVISLLRGRANADATAFRLYSHVTKTLAIASFVIIEESGIAKGVRRIIAYTGEEAIAADERATLLEARFTLLSKLENATEQERAMKAMDDVRLTPFFHLLSNRC